jgi:amidase
MTIRVQDVRQLAERAGLELTAAEAEAFVAPSAALLQEFEATAARLAVDAEVAPARRQIAFHPADDVVDGVPVNAFVHRFDSPPTGEGPLSGLRVGIKDAVAIAGVPRTRGRRTGWDWPQRDATVVSRILAAGGRIVGTLNLDAWSASATGEGSHFGLARNPHGADRLPGGSSSGAGSAVAHGMVELAVGTDTAGSARIPASWCGIVALKPSHGIIPADGVLGLDPTLEDVCPMARSSTDCARLFSVMSGREVEIDRGPWRVGLVEGVEYGCDEGTRAALKSAAQHLNAAGCTVETIEIPRWRDAWEIESLLLASGVPYLIRTGWQGRWCMPTDPPVHGDARPPQLIALWSLALEALGTKSNEYHWIAQQARQRLARATEAALQRVDVLLTPTTPSTAPRIAPKIDGDLLATSSGGATPVITSILTTPANLTGVPALALPCGRDADWMPCSIQLHAAADRESTLFSAARIIEDAVHG